MGPLVEEPEIPSDSSQLPRRLQRDTTVSRSDSVKAGDSTVASASGPDELENDIHCPRILVSIYAVF
jgi:hypothetical protein